MSLPMYQPNEPLSKIKYSIAIAAGKGGVGKSSVTVNLALALQTMGLKVGVLDTDIYGPSIRKMLPEEKLPSQKGTIIQPALCHGIKMISMAYFRKESEASAIRAPIANSLITQFVKNVEWGELDFLLIDFPPGTGDVQITLCQQASLTGAIMVTTPQEVAIMDVKKAIHLFDQVKVPILGIVENMSYYTIPGSEERHYLFGKGGGEKLAQEGHIPFLGTIPLDSDLCACGDKGESLFILDHTRKKPATQAFIKLADSLITQLESKKEDKPFREIRKIDESTFLMTWNDGIEQQLRMSELQRNCSCANCVEEYSGKRIVDPSSIDENVRAHEIRHVGRYGLRIQFSSGCSTGIYSFDMIRKLKENSEFGIRNSEKK
jgi:ATP-binding protein involved in chromosome partitioning